MASPFCLACGATLAEGTRFCVKCGTAVGPSSQQPVASSQNAVDGNAPTVEMRVPPLPPPPVMPAPAPPPVPPPPLVFTPVPAPQQYTPPPSAPVSKSGSGVGVWIGLIGLILLLGGAGLWFYVTRMSGVHVPGQKTTVETAAAPAVQPAPAPPPVEAAPAPAPAPSESTRPEDIPPNPDFANKNPAPEARPAAPERSPASRAARGGGVRPNPTPSNPTPSRPTTSNPASSNPTSGTLHATVEVAQFGEVVFEGLPGARLRFIFDHDAWQPTIHRQPNGTQTLVMRSLRPGIQRVCDVKWEMAQ